MTTKQTLLDLAEFMREKGIEYISGYNDKYDELPFIKIKDHPRKGEYIIGRTDIKRITPDDIGQAAKEMEE